MKKYTIFVGVFLCATLIDSGMKKVLRLALYAAIVLLGASCSSTKYVPEGSYLLDEVRIHTDNKDVKPSSLSLYVRQNPNAKWFSLVKTQLYVYNMSGRDSTRWINRILHRMGDAPVIYSEDETERTRDEIGKAVRNMGYMGATVAAVPSYKGKKVKLTYRVTTGKAYKVRTLNYDIPDEKIRKRFSGQEEVNDLHHDAGMQGSRFDVPDTEILLQSGVSSKCKA